MHQGLLESDVHPSRSPHPPTPHKPHKAEDALRVADEPGRAPAPPPNPGRPSSPPPASGTVQFRLVQSSIFQCSLPYPHLSSGLWARPYPAAPRRRAPSPWRPAPPRCGWQPGRGPTGCGGTPSGRHRGRVGVGNCFVVITEQGVLLRHRQGRMRQTPGPDGRMRPMLLVCV